MDRSIGNVRLLNLSEEREKTKPHKLLIIFFEIYESQSII